MLNKIQWVIIRKNLKARWADVDPNMHLRHAALMDYTDQVRVAYFDSKGFSFLNLRKLKIGSVIFKVTTRYKKEIHLSETMTINCKLDHLSGDYRKWKISHDIFSCTNRPLQNTNLRMFRVDQINFAVGQWM